LFLAGVGLFIQNPLSIRDLGFQLSFTAAWGMVVLAPRFMKTAWMERVPAPFRSAAASAIAAQAATLPILIVAFHRLSIIGLFVNVFILFVLGSVLEVGLIGVILSFSGWLCAPFFQVSLWLLAGTNEVLRILASVPYADVWIINPGPLFWLIWYGGIGITVCGKGHVFFRLRVGLLYLKGRIGGIVPPAASFLAKLDFLLPHTGVPPRRGLTERKRFFIHLGWLAVIAIIIWSPWNSSADLELDVIDVGQGDSILVRTPEGHAILIDAGPRSERFDAGERILLPYLLQTGIRHLDAVLITHEHQDHIGGIRSVLDNVPTDWIGVPNVGDRLENDEWKSGLPQGLLYDSQKFKTLQTGDRIELDSGASLEVLGPEQVLANTHSDPNNNSLVLKLTYLGQNVLLTADMEQEEMEEIAASGVDLETDIFKEPHHGSRFSLDKPWLDGIHPRAVIISVGKNTFGHPAPEVLKYWDHRNVPVYRTDEEGTLRLFLRTGGIEIVPGRQSS
jgi:competence protein ComEC